MFVFSVQDLICQGSQWFHEIIPMFLENQMNILLLLNFFILISSFISNWGLSNQKNRIEDIFEELNNEEPKSPETPVVIPRTPSKQTKRTYPLRSRKRRMINFDDFPMEKTEE